MTNVIEHVKNIRNKLTLAGISFVSIGRMQEKIFIYIKVKNDISIDVIRKLLNKEENNLIEIEKS